MDGDSGRVLYSKNENERKLIASTTKIMTSIVALENSDLDNRFVVGDEIDNVYGSMTYIKKGEKFTLNDLLHGLMLQSGNDAAMVIASNVMNYDHFIAKMNIKAFKIGMYNTSFENPHGLNEKTKNYSTAYDLALLMKYAIKNDDFLKITTTSKYKIGNYIWYNKNRLLKDYKYLISGKIGYTDDSGPVYVSSARKDGKTLIIASIDEGDKFNLHKKLYKEFFKKYNKHLLLDKDTISKVINNKDNYYYIDNDFYMLLKPGEEEKVNIKVNLSNSANEICIYFDDKLVHKEKLYMTSYAKTMKKQWDLLSFFKL